MSDPNLPVPQGGAAPATGDPQLGAIELKTSFFPLAFLLYLFPAKAVIDGHSELAHGWGTKVYPVPAGRHTVRVWCPYFGMMKMGDGNHELDVVAGQVTAVEWKCPWLVFLGGSFVALGVRGLTQADLQNGASAMSAIPAPPAIGAVSQNPGIVAPVTPQAPAIVGVQAGWHPDPQGQAALRYWDGQQWTEHVSDGQATTA